MREEKLREIAECQFCGKPFGHCNSPMFYRVKVERFCVKVGALQRQQGLAMMLGGNAQLASIMGPDEDMTENVGSSEFTVCDECALEKQHCTAALLEDL